MLNPGELLIHSGNAHLFTQAPSGQGFGLIPRNFQTHPLGSMQGAPVSAVARIPRSEWPERIREQAAAKARLSDVRNTGKDGQPIPSLDQNGYGYCWNHSTGSCALLGRAKDGQPFADLSPYACGCIIKNYRNEGGWNGESMKFIRERGYPTSEFWPQRSTSRSNDNPRTWENAALHKMTEWDDIPEGDFDLQITYSLLGMPYALDLNWWSHSVCGCDAVDGTASFNAGLLRSATGKLQTAAEFEAEWEVADYGAAFGARIWNSWADSWGDAGMGVLTEAKARNNGAIALRVTTGSVK